MTSFNPMMDALKKLRAERKASPSPVSTTTSSSTTTTTATSLPRPTTSSTLAPTTSTGDLLERVVRIPVKHNLTVQLRILQDPGGQQYGHGATVWDSSILLGQYLSKMEGRELMKASTKVLTLGCGCGLVGLTSSTLGCDVTLTDLETVLPLTNINIDKNINALRMAIAFSKDKDEHGDVHRSNKPVARALDWRTQDDFVDEKYDLILGADLMYELTLAEPLAATCDRLAATGADVLIGYEHRKDSVLVAYVQAFERHGFVMTEIQRNGRWADDLSLYMLKRMRGEGAGVGVVGGP